MSRALLWFGRHDLRLDDHAGLARAIRDGHEIIPVFLWCPHEEKSSAPGAASRWWLHHALLDLQAALTKVGSRLILRTARRGETSQDLLEALGRQTGARSLIFSRRFDPNQAERDASLMKRFRADGWEVVMTNNDMLLEPESVSNLSGGPYQVFTPLWKHYQSRALPKPVDVTFPYWRSPATWPATGKVNDLDLLPKHGWGEGLESFWGVPHRSVGLKRFDDFLSRKVDDYPRARDIPAEDGTSRLSPYLHHGQIGVREVWHQLANQNPDGLNASAGFGRQLIWREFGRHLLHHFPATPSTPLREPYSAFPWSSSDELLKAWQRGETGYPIVDAGMRQLWQTGWMPNRVRMLAGSLLVKQLLQDWRQGASWFWDTLVDADLGNNTLGWQWVAGCGADASPYFRIFNPVTQGEKWDPRGTYVRRHLPELANVPDSAVHQPWTLSKSALDDAGVELGRHYPLPIVDHADGRRRALAALQTMKNRIQ